MQDILDVPSQQLALGSLRIERLQGRVLANGSEVALCHDEAPGTQLQRGTQPVSGSGGGGGTSSHQVLCREGGLTRTHPSHTAQVPGAHSGFVFPKVASAWKLTIQRGQAGLAALT